MPPTKISIVIATFNAGHCLGDCLKSCIDQTWEHKEIIIIDGASTDNTLEIIKRFAEHISFWLSEPDTGIYDAWNKALPHVKGSWVLFRGADDLFWNEQTLEKAIDGLSQALPHELICYGTVVSVDENQIVTGIKGVPWDQARRRFFKEMSITHSGVFHHKQIFTRFGRFDPSYRIAGDYDFLLRALSNDHVQCKFLSDVIITKMSGGGISNTLGFTTKRESITALKRNGVSAFPFAQYQELLVIAFRRLQRKLLYSLLGNETAGRLLDRRRRLRAKPISRKIMLIEKTGYQL